VGKPVPDEISMFEESENVLITELLPLEISLPAANPAEKLRNDPDPEVPSGSVPPLTCNLAPLSAVAPATTLPAEVMRMRSANTAALRVLNVIDEEDTFPPPPLNAPKSIIALPAPAEVTVVKKYAPAF
jgi:hypothetical protein